MVGSSYCGHDDNEDSGFFQEIFSKVLEIILSVNVKSEISIL